MGLVFHLICLFFYTVCITKLCQQRVSRKGTPAAAVGFRADCTEQFLSHYLLCYGRGKDTSYTDRFTGHSHAVSYDSLCG